MNYNDILKKYDSVIIGYAKRIDHEDYEDYAQEIRLYILKHLPNYDPTKSNIGYYVQLCAKTAFRRLVFDVKKQEYFERNFARLADNHTIEVEYDGYDEFIQHILEKLNKDSQRTVFYAILYNVGEPQYTKIAARINMNYQAFLNNLKAIREAVNEVLAENRT